MQPTHLGNSRGNHAVVDRLVATHVERLPFDGGGISCNNCCIHGAKIFDMNGRPGNAWRTLHTATSPPRHSCTRARAYLGLDDASDLVEFLEHAREQAAVELRPVAVGEPKANLQRKRDSFIALLRCCMQRTLTPITLGN